MATFGEKVREYRKKHGLSQNQLAAIIGASSGQPVISRWERESNQKRHSATFLRREMEKLLSPGVDECRPWLNMWFEVFCAIEIER